MTDFPIKRFDFPNGRFYAPGDEWWKENGRGDKPFKFSSTSWCEIYSKGVGFNKWLGDAKSYEDAMAYANRRAEIGTIVHELIVYLLNNKKIDFDSIFSEIEIPADSEEEIIKYLMHFQAFYEKYQPEPLFLEKTMLNFDLPWAGTADFVGYIQHNGRKLALLDWKTGNPYPVSHTPQLISYQILWDSLHDTKIELLAPVYFSSGWRKNPPNPPKIKPIKFQPEIWEATLMAMRVKMYNEGILKSLEDDPQPRPKLELPKTLDISEPS